MPIDPDLAAAGADDAGDAALLACIEAFREAVAAGDRRRALELAGEIRALLARRREGDDRIERLISSSLDILDQRGPGREESEDIARGGPPTYRGPLTRSEAIDRSPAAPAPTAPGVVYPVWFGTNRRPNRDGTDFTAERASETSHGRVDVFVPEAHRTGETGTSFWRRLLRRDLRDDRLRMQGIAALAPDEFYRDLRETIEEARRDGESHALVYLHGYRTSFEEAAIRAAQIGFDLKVLGATAFFSWPSRGRLASYPGDEAAIEASESAIADFLVAFAERCGADRIHVVAHSMGNRGLLRALQRITLDAEARGRFRLSQIFLAAPDVDRDLFLDLARVYPTVSERTTLYASRADWAVYLSSLFHAAPRAGYFEPVTVAPGVDTVTVPDFDVDLLGHSYFANAEALLYDIAGLMRRDEPPERRQRIVEQAATTSGRYWMLRR